MANTGMVTSLSQNVPAALRGRQGRLLHWSQGQLVQSHGTLRGPQKGFNFFSTQKKNMNLLTSEINEHFSGPILVC